MESDKVAEGVSSTQVGTPPAPGEGWHGADELRRHLMPISRLKPFPGNSRRGDVPKIAESLRRFGQVRPVLATHEDGEAELTIVAGHHVTMAAQSLGWDEIAVVVADFETREDALDYLIADNQLAQLGGFDKKDQMTILDDVAKRGSFEGTGFTEADYRDQRLLEQHRASLENLAELKRHGEDYRKHPDEQIEAMANALKRYGMTRPVVVSKDGYILAGSLTAEAARSLGMKRIPVVRLTVDHDDTDAIAVMVADREMDTMTEVDDRALVRGLAKLADEGKLEGTGYDNEKLANLIHVTRPPSKSKRVDEQAEWERKGMPGFKAFEKIILAITCDTAELREQLAEQLNLHCRKGVVWSARWPARRYEDPSSLFWQGREYCSICEEELKPEDDVQRGIDGTAAHNSCIVTVDELADQMDAEMESGPLG